MNRLAIALVTHKRTDIAVRTVKGLCKHLKFDGEVGWYVGVDGNDYEHAHEVVTAITGCGGVIVGQHVEDLTPGVPHAGPCWNLALKKALEWSDVVLWMENDWELHMDLDITEYVRILRVHEDIGMVRLGLMPILLDLHSIGRDGNIYLRCEKSAPYAFSGNPHLKHQRFVDAYGWYVTDKNPGEMEVAIDNHIRKTDGPMIVFPWEQGGRGTYGPFSHIGGDKSFDPKE